MGKLAIFVIALVLIAIFWLSNKIKKNKHEERKPFINSSLDEKLEMLQDELKELEKTLPMDLEKHQAKVEAIKSKIEKVKETKKKFDS
ncbi:MAG: hypothetical protein V4547_18050 [Bacteroidota bacterium]